MLIRPNVESDFKVIAVPARTTRRIVHSDSIDHRVCAENALRDQLADGVQTNDWRESAEESKCPENGGATRCGLA
ncbi:MAG: hypothetical protein ACPGXX_18155, partial [Planctomycetaceae bacterium]